MRPVPALAVLEGSGLSKTTRVVHLLPADAQAALDRRDIAAYAAPINTGPLLVVRGDIRSSTARRTTRGSRAAR